MMMMTWMKKPRSLRGELRGWDLRRLQHLLELEQQVFGQIIKLEFVAPYLEPEEVLKKY